MDNKDLEFDFVTDIDFTTILDKEEKPEPKESAVEEQTSRPTADEPYVPRRGGRYAPKRYRKATMRERLNIFSGLFTPLGKGLKKFFSKLNSKLDPLAEWMCDKWDALCAKRSSSGRAVEFFDPVADLLCDVWDRICGRKTQRDEPIDKKALIAPSIVLAVIIAAVIFGTVSIANCAGCGKPAAPPVSESDVSETDISISSSDIVEMTPVSESDVQTEDEEFEEDEDPDGDEEDFEESEDDQ